MNRLDKSHLRTESEGGRFTNENKKRPPIRRVGRPPLGRRRWKIFFNSRGKGYISRVLKFSCVQYPCVHIRNRNSLVYRVSQVGGLGSPTVSIQSIRLRLRPTRKYSLHSLIVGFIFSVITSTIPSFLVRSLTFRVIPR